MIRFVLVLDIWEFLNINFNHCIVLGHRLPCFPADYPGNGRYPRCTSAVPAAPCVKINPMNPVLCSGFQSGERDEELAWPMKQE